MAVIGLDLETPCWDWPHSRRDKNGYAVYKQQRAHRVFYEMIVGTIPEGLVLDHLCRNEGCVNPQHVEPVTHRENILRGEGEAAKNAVKTHCKYGHALEGRNLYIQPSTGKRGCKTCNRLKQQKYRAKKRKREIKV